MFFLRYWRRSGLYTACQLTGKNSPPLLYFFRKCWPLYISDIHWIEIPLSFSLSLFSLFSLSRSVYYYIPLSLSLRSFVSPKPPKYFSWNLTLWLCADWRLHLSFSLSLYSLQPFSLSRVFTTVWNEQFSWTNYYQQELRCAACVGMEHVSDIFASFPPFTERKTEFTI